MSAAILVRVRIIVDPAGRVLVHELERLAPNEPDDRRPPYWYQRAECVTHELDVMLPCPTITTPQLTYVGTKART